MNDLDEANDGHGGAAMARRTTGSEGGGMRGTGERSGHLKSRSSRGAAMPAERRGRAFRGSIGQGTSDDPRPSLADGITSHFAGDATGLDRVRRAVDGLSLADVIRDFAFEADAMRPLTADFPDLLPSIDTVRVRGDSPDAFRRAPTILLDVWICDRWFFYRDLYTHKQKSASALEKLDEIVRMASEWLNKIFHLLCVELIGADGVSPQSNERKPIEGRTWKRKNLVLKLDNSDLFDHGIGGVLWRDVILRDPRCRVSTNPPTEIKSPRGRKERIAYLAALSRLFERGDLETTASSGGELTRQIESALVDLGYERPSESQIRRWLDENLKGLWNRATGGG